MKRAIGPCGDYLTGASTEFISARRMVKVDNGITQRPLFRRAAVWLGGNRRPAVRHLLRRVSCIDSPIPAASQQPGLRVNWRHFLFSPPSSYSTRKCTEGSERASERASAYCTTQRTLAVDRHESMMPKNKQMDVACGGSFHPSAAIGTADDADSAFFRLFARSWAAKGSLWRDPDANAARPPRRLLGEESM